MGSKKKGVPFTIGAMIAFAIALSSLLPFISMYIAIPLAILVLVGGMATGIFRLPTLFEAVITPLILIAMVLLATWTGLYSFSNVPFFTMLLAVLVADVIIFVTGMVPWVGDFVGSVIVGIQVWAMIGGLSGFILATLASIVALLPGPIPLCTIVFIALWIGAKSILGV